jgi:hypothetical protein
MRLANLPERHSVASYSASGQTVGVGMEGGGVMLWRTNPDAAAEAESVLGNGKPQSIRFLLGLGQPIAALRVVDKPAETVLAVDLEGRILEWSSRAIADVASPIILNRFSGNIDTGFDGVPRPHVSISAKADVIVASTFDGIFTWSRQEGVRKVVAGADNELPLRRSRCPYPGWAEPSFYVGGQWGTQDPCSDCPIGRAPCAETASPAVRLWNDDRANLRSNRELSCRRFPLRPGSRLQRRQESSSAPSSRPCRVRATECWQFYRHNLSILRRQILR